MKKIFTALILCVMATTAFAQHRHYPHGSPGHRYTPQRGYHNNGNIGWLVPALIGGAIIYGATRETPPPPPQVVVVPQPPVYSQAPSQQVRDVCPEGYEATYSRKFLRDNYGNVREYYDFNGCVQQR